MEICLSTLEVGSDPILIRSAEDGTAHMLLPNTIGVTQWLEEGTLLGEAVEVEVLLDMSPAAVNVVLSHVNPPPSNVKSHQKKLEGILNNDQVFA